MCNCNICSRPKYNCSDPCNWCQTTPVTNTSCLPTPCLTGCLDTNYTNCVFLSADLDLCGTVFVKGTKLHTVLEGYKDAICEGIPTPSPSADIYSKVSVNDTTSSYLGSKLTAGNGIALAILNAGLNEQLQISATISSDADNCLTFGTDNKLYVECPATPSGTVSLITVTDTPSIDFTLTPIVNGYNILANVVLSANVGNDLTNPNGLYLNVPYKTCTDVRACFTAGTGISIVGGVITNTQVDVDTDTRLSNPHMGVGAPVGYVRLFFDLLDVVAATSTVDFTYVDIPTAVVNPAAFTVSDTDTVNLTLAGVDVSADVILSADAGNQIIYGTDGALFVETCEVPFAAHIYNDGTDIYFKFTGDSLVAADYEVEFRGTTGLPMFWINGDAQYTGISSGELSYYMMTDAAARSACEIIVAKVRKICTNSESEWVTAVYNVNDDLVLFSSNGNIDISQTDCGTLDLNVNTDACTPYISSNFNQGLVVYDGHAFLQLTKTIGVDFETLDIIVTYTNTSAASTSIQSIMSSNTFASTPTLIYLPDFDLANNQTITIRIVKMCNGLHSSAASTPLTILLGVIASACNDESWIEINNTNFVTGGTTDQGQGYDVYNHKVPYADPVPAYYRNKNKELRLAGNCIIETDVTSGGCNVGAGESGWFDILDVSAFICTPSTITEEYYGVVYAKALDLVDYECGVINNSLAPAFVSIDLRRNGNMLQANIDLQDIDTYSGPFIVPLSGIVIG